MIEKKHNERMKQLAPRLESCPPEVAVWRQAAGRGAGGHLGQRLYVRCSRSLSQSTDRLAAALAKRHGPRQERLIRVWCVRFICSSVSFNF